MGKLSKGLATFATGGLNLVGDYLKGPKMPQGDFNAQLEADKQNALFNFKLNNNISNPFGSQSVVSDGTGGWKTQTSYAQPIQNSITGYMNSLPGLQQKAMSRLQGPSAFEDPNYRQNLQDAMLSRMNFAGDEESLRTRLANQGLTEGSEAWNREMNVFNQGKNDARMQAFLGSGQEMNNLMGIEQQARLGGVNELNAVNASMQGLAPQFQMMQSNYNLSNPARDQYGEALDKYNSQMAQRNQLMGGLFQLGGAAIGGAGGGK